MSLCFTLIFSSCLAAVYSIRIQRDFNRYPSIETFDTYWNVPTFMCHKYGINFEEAVRSFGIKMNRGDQFRGEEVAILYDPGNFPAMLKNTMTGTFLERNGGIPQRGNLTYHLDMYIAVLDQLVQKDFRGVLVIDFEAWRPVYRQNWGDNSIYKSLSVEHERQKHPQWSETKIQEMAKTNFEAAGRVFMEKTIQVTRLKYPRAMIGYYAYPYCFNMREDNGMSASCSSEVVGENNGIQWLFDASSALYPSLYLSNALSEKGYSSACLVKGRMNEAWRVLTRCNCSKSKLIFPYIWYKYYDSLSFLSQKDFHAVLETTRKYKTGGIVIWGATKDVNSADKCKEVMKYLNTVIGPTIQRVRSKNYKEFPIQDDPAVEYYTAEKELPRYHPTEQNPSKPYHSEQHPSSYKSVQYSPSNSDKVVEFVPLILTPKDNGSYYEVASNGKKLDYVYKVIRSERSTEKTDTKKNSTSTTAAPPSHVGLYQRIMAAFLRLMG